MMNPDEIRDYCLMKDNVEESLPFGPGTLVFKVRGKIFVLMSLDEEVTGINLKCDPERALALREEFNFVLPGYHMNKKHWNTIRCVPGLTNVMLKEWIDHSYALVSHRKQ